MIDVMMIMNTDGHRVAFPMKNILSIEELGHDNEERSIVSIIVSHNTNSNKSYCTYVSFLKLWNMFKTSESLDKSYSK